MIQEATFVGELVRALADRGTQGRVSRAFHSSAYIKVKDGVVLLLRGGLRSPMTVNIGGRGDLRKVVAVGDRFEINGQSLSSRRLLVGLGHARTHRSRLAGSEAADPMTETDIVKAATALRQLYSVSNAGLSLVEGKALEKFVSNVLLPFTGGDPRGVYAAGNYRELLGSGTGFTPAGDDLIAGFVASFNLVAKAIGADKITLPVGDLAVKTVPESAAIMDYAQRGYVDEGLESLILAAFRNEPEEFRGHIFDLAKRGHTSGLDMSLGVLLAVASVGDHERGGHALESSFDTLRGSTSSNSLIRLPWAAP